MEHDQEHYHHRLSNIEEAVREVKHDTAATLKQVQVTNGRVTMLERKQDENDVALYGDHRPGRHLPGLFERVEGVESLAHSNRELVFSLDKLRDASITVAKWLGGGAGSVAVAWIVKVLVGA